MVIVTKPQIIDSLFEYNNCNFKGAKKTGVVSCKRAEETNGRHVHYRWKGYYECFSDLICQHI